MKVINIADVQPEEVMSGLFTGPVYAQNLIDSDTAKGFRFGLVKFSPGIKNRYHTHTNEQVLFVTEGKGIVATENEEIVLTPGMLVYIPVGEKHWHGATDDSSFAHIAITAAPSKTEY